MAVLHCKDWGGVLLPPAGQACPPPETRYPTGTTLHRPPRQGGGFAAFPPMPEVRSPRIPEGGPHGPSPGEEPGRRRGRPTTDPPRGGLRRARQPCPPGHPHPERGGRYHRATMRRRRAGRRELARLPRPGAPTGLTTRARRAGGPACASTGGFSMAVFPLRALRAVEPHGPAWGWGDMP